MSGIQLASTRQASRLRRFWSASGAGIAALPVTAWTPANLTNPAKLWVDHGSPITGTTTLSQWNDRSASALHMMANGFPVINAAGLNGKRTIGFPSTSDMVSNGDLGAREMYRNTNKAWVFFVYKCNDTDTSLRHLLYAGTPITNGARINIAATNGVARRPAIRVRRLDGDAIATLNASAGLDTNPHMLLAVIDYATGAAELWIDGAIDAQNPTLVSAGATSDTAPTQSLFLASLSGSSSTNSDIAAMLTGSGSLPTSTEIDKLFGYYADQFALQALLPAGHPYKSAAPTN